MFNRIDNPEPRRPGLLPGLLKMSSDEAKRAGQNFATILTTFRAEVIKAGMKETDVNDLIKGMVAQGACCDGYMGAPVAR